MARRDFTYTGGGRLATRTDRKGVITSFGYDRWRLLRKSYSDGSEPVVLTYATPNGSRQP